MLTEKQKALLAFIERYQLENGASPTLREMRKHFGVQSDNSILKLLKKLEEGGHIKKDDTPRGIKLLESVRAKLQATSRQIPIVGAIPAGGPVLSEEYLEGYLAVDEHSVRHPERCFVLRVRGDSMRDAGILDGDYVIADKDREPRNNDIVIALVDQENTVKRYVSEGGKVYLKPENAAYTNIYPLSELCVQGVVVGLWRKYD